MKLRCLSILACLLINIAAVAGVMGATNGFEHFVTRDGNRLMDGDTEFRFMGANMPGLVVPYDFTLRLPEHMTLPTPWEIEDAMKTLSRMGMMPQHPCSGHA